MGRLDRVSMERASLEIALCTRAIERGMPFLGICGGMQTLAVAMGGSLIQDIATQCPDAGLHEQPTSPDLPWHGLRTEKGWEWLGERVNSTHHQAIDRPGSLSVVGRAPDGIIEAVIVKDHPFAIGVQWHPEWLDKALFFKLIQCCPSGKHKTTTIVFPSCGDSKM
mgnify:FL=1